MTPPFPTPSKTLGDAWRRYRFFILVGVVWLILDQISKLWIVASLPYGTYHGPPRITVIEDFFYIVHIGNYGAAFGMFQGAGLWLSLLAIVFLVALIIFRRAVELHKPVQQVIFGLISGGIAGNLIDRLARGHVVDFLDFHLPLVDYRWPAFNFADIGIVVGVIVYLFLSLFVVPKDEASGNSVDQAPNPPSGQSTGEPHRSSHPE